VLVAGGYGSTETLASTELYDPTSGTWAVTGSLAQPRLQHSATLLANGQVLVAGGTYDTNRAELYDPASGNWSATDSLATTRFDHTAVLLPNGRVLVASGNGDDSFVSAELYDVGLGFHKVAQPKIKTANFTTQSHRLRLTGANFQGISQASGGNTQDSSTNYPLVQLRALGNDQVSFLLADGRRGWSDTTFTSLPPTGFVAGPALVTVFTNGIPSEAKYVLLPR
jgi:hypothetical protein